MDKFEQLKLYEAKQKLVGRVFDFIIEKGEILIFDYYDAPSRKIVIIPDFVDGFKVSFDLEQEGSVFFRCRYVEKVIMNSNVHGSLRGIFKSFKGSELDLTDFDTSNINDMSIMFNYCESKSITFSEKFDTSNVKYMDHIFRCCCAQLLDLRYFNMNKVQFFECMFDYCESNEIYLPVGIPQSVFKRIIENSDTPNSVYKKIYREH